MQKLAVLSLLSCMIFVGAAFARDNRPVAFLGYPTYKVTLLRVLVPENIAFEECEQWLPPGDYPRYSAIFMEAPLGKLQGRTGEAMWDTPVCRTEVETYLQSGGVIIFTAGAFAQVTQGRDSDGLASILGFTESALPKSGTIQGKENACRVRIANRASPVTAHLAKERYDWLAETPLRFAVKTTTAETLAEIIDEEAQTVSPFITVNKVGQGAVYWFGSSLASPYAKRGGKPDEETEAYAQAILHAILRGNPAHTPGLKKEPWNPQPLGNSQ